MKRKSFWLLTVVLALLLLLPTTAFAAEGDIPMDATHFPNENFRKYLTTAQDKKTLQKVDVDQNGVLSKDERDAVTQLDLQDLQAQELTGIGYFENLEILSASKGNIASLDVHENTNLKEIRLYECQVQEAVFGTLPKLTVLGITNSNLQQVDLSGLPALEIVSFDQNALNTLDLSHNPNVTLLNCTDNAFESLDLSHQPLLTSLDCTNNRITSILFHESGNLQWLECGENCLDSICVKDFSNLTALDCSGNRLSNLDVRANKQLETLDCANNQLTALDITQNTLLNSLYCQDNPIEMLDTRFNSKLYSFSLYGVKSLLVDPDNQNLHFWPQHLSNGESAPKLEGENGFLGVGGVVVFEDGFNTMSFTYHRTKPDGTEESYSIMAHYHQIVFVPETAPTCEYAGMKAHYACSCGKIYADAEGKEEITDLSSLELPKTNHRLEVVPAIFATCTKEGRISHYRCPDCGKHFRDIDALEEIADLSEMIVPAKHHADAEFVPGVAPTTEAEGRKAYYVCPDCGKYFEDAACTKEITEEITVWRVIPKLNDEPTVPNPDVTPNVPVTPEEKPANPNIPKTGSATSGNLLALVSAAGGFLCLTALKRKEKEQF